MKATVIENAITIQSAQEFAGSWYLTVAIDSENPYQAFKVLPEDQANVAEAVPAQPAEESPQIHSQRVWAADPAFASSSATGFGLIPRRALNWSRVRPHRAWHLARRGSTAPERPHR